MFLFKPIFVNFNSVYRLGINHLRLIRQYSKNDAIPTVSDCENYLSKFVSVSTARKIIRDLVDLNLVKKEISDSDKRVKYLKVENINIDELLDGNW